MNDRFTRIRESDWLPIFASVIWAIIGAVASPTVERLWLQSFFTTTEGAILTLLSVLILAIASSVTVASAFVRQADKRERAWIETAGRIREQLGTPAEIIFEPIEQSYGTFYRRLADFTRQASDKDEILVMAHCGPRGGYENPNETKEYKEARGEYSKALLQKVAEPGITYRRIICFDEGPDRGKITVGRVKKWLLNHCRDMLKIRKGKPDKISLMKAEVVLDQDILLIGKKTAVISLDIRDPETGLVHTDGTLIFHNPPNARIIDQVYSFFMRALGSGKMVKKVPEDTDETA